MRALILGVTGQDGSYLEEHLLSEGYEVFGLVRRFNAQTLAQQIVGDITDRSSLDRALKTCEPHIVFNCAAVTSPGGAWGVTNPPNLAQVTGCGVINLLDAMCQHAPSARLVHASSSAIYDPHRYGLYGITKQFAHDAVVGYRSRLWCSNAVLFSHSSPRQDPRFLAPRICSTVARIARGSGELLHLGDIYSRRDWGYAPDYVRAMRLVAEHPRPSDWTIATGVTRTVRDVALAAVTAAGLDWDDVVRVDPDAPRVPHEVHPDSQEDRLAAMRELGWKPETSLVDMVTEMVRSK